MKTSASDIGEDKWVMVDLGYFRFESGVKGTGQLTTLFLAFFF